MLIRIFGTETVELRENSTEVGLLFVSECFDVVRMGAEVSCLIFHQGDLEGICELVQEEDCGRRELPSASFKSSDQRLPICVLLLLPTVPFLSVLLSQLDPWSMLFLVILIFDIVFLFSLAPKLGSLMNLSSSSIFTLPVLNLPLLLLMMFPEPNLLLLLTLLSTLPPLDLLMLLTFPMLCCELVNKLCKVEAVPLLPPTANLKYDCCLLTHW